MKLILNSLLVLLVTSFSLFYCESSKAISIEINNTQIRHYNQVSSIELTSLSPDTKLQMSQIKNCHVTAPTNSLDKSHAQSPKSFFEWINLFNDKLQSWISSISQVIAKIDNLF